MRVQTLSIARKVCLGSGAGTVGWKTYNYELSVIVHTIPSLAAMKYGYGTTIIYKSCASNQTELICCTLNWHNAAI